MAPEQHGGEPVDARTDQFAFCVALYEALYGQPPFAGASYRELADNVLAGNVVAPASSDVPASVRNAILRGLSRDPDARFAAMDELLAVLSEAARTRRRRSWIAIGAIVFGASIATLIWWSTRDAPAPSAAPPAEPSTPQEAYRLGVIAYSKGDFPGAIVGFKRALALDFGHREWFYNLGQAYRMNGECSEALFAYRAFLGTSPGSNADGGPPRARADAEKLIATLEDCLGQVQSGAPTNACGCRDLPIADH